MIGDKLVLFLVHMDQKPVPKANAKQPIGRVNKWLQDLEHPSTTKFIQDL